MKLRLSVLVSVLGSLLAVVCLSNFAVAQDEPPPKPPEGPSAEGDMRLTVVDERTFGSIGGVVTRSKDQSPLRRVRVMLYPFVVTEAAFEGRPNLYSVETDAAGRFKISKIRPGKYWLSLSKPGHFWLDDRVRGSNRTRMAMVLEPSQHQDELAFAMSSAAVIAGNVYDSEGEPARFATVNALRLTRSGGKRKFVKVRTVEANDIGEYRLYDLQPGRYFVSAQGANPLRAFMTDQSEENMMLLAAMFTPGVEGSEEVQTNPRIVATYFPGTVDSAQAASVAVLDGDQGRADFTVQVVTPVRINGHMTGMPPGMTPQLTIQKKGARGRGEEAFLLEGEMPLKAQLDGDSKFHVTGVSPGDYVISAWAYTEGGKPKAEEQKPKLYSGRAEVTVTPGGDVQNVELTLRELQSLQGRITVEGFKPGKPDAPFPVALEFFSETEEDLRYFANANAKGEFELQTGGEISGNLRATLSRGRGASVDGYYLKSVRAGGIDVLDKGLSLGGGAPIEAVVGNRPATLEVLAAAGEKPKPAGGVTVVLFPADHPEQPHRYDKAVTDQNGKATFKGLAPGEYNVVAWEQDPDTLDKSVFEREARVNYESVRDQEFMKPYAAQLVKVSVKEGQRAQAAVRVVPAEQGE